jgi:hypothetical protein
MKRYTCSSASIHYTKRDFQYHIDKCQVEASALVFTYYAELTESEHWISIICCIEDDNAG